ncbi:MAG: fatty acid desaturase [Anaerolineae bacterium]
METTPSRAAPRKPASGAAAKPPPWKSLVAKYQKPDVSASIQQFCVTLAAFLGMAALTMYSLNIGYWLTVLLAIPTAGFLVRLFIVQHDCGHGSFFRSRKLNDSVGMICSIFTLTPYHYWQRSHSIHHAHANNLEHRGIGDIYLMTVNEYQAQNWWGRLRYRLYRNPIVLFIIGPSLMFIVIHRFPGYSQPAMKKVAHTVWWTDLALLIFYGALALLVGWQAVAITVLTVMFFAAGAGMWLFYVQHQFEGVQWDHEEKWDFGLAALQGASYYKLPRILQWFTGNIGFHHIHHLSPRIPNYKLEQCHNENEMFQDATVLTIPTSLKMMTLTLWDEERRELISFRELKQRQKKLTPQTAQS